MKKAKLALFILLLVLLAACTTEAETTTTIAIVSTTNAPEPTTIAFPPPDSISLKPDGYFEAEYELSYEYQHRRAFYSIPGNLEIFVAETHPDVWSWVDENIIENQDAPAVMSVVRLIQKFDISKKDFVYVIEDLREGRRARGHDLNDEFWELPNADIIYTFDNDIINAYYRRENPVAPDWEKITVYESYSAYLEANPQ